MGSGVGSLPPRPAFPPASPLSAPPTLGVNYHYFALGFDLIRTCNQDNIFNNHFSTSTESSEGNWLFKSTATQEQLQKGYPLEPVIVGFPLEPLAEGFLWSLLHNGRTSEFAELADLPETGTEDKGNIVAEPFHGGKRRQDRFK